MTMTTFHHGSSPRHGTTECVSSSPKRKFQQATRHHHLISVIVIMMITVESMGVSEGAKSSNIRRRVMAEDEEQDSFSCKDDCVRATCKDSNYLRCPTSEQKTTIIRDCIRSCKQQLRDVCNDLCNTPDVEKGGNRDMCMESCKKYNGSLDGESYFNKGISLQEGTTSERDEVESKMETGKDNIAEDTENQNDPQQAAHDGDKTKDKKETKDTEIEDLSTDEWLAPGIANTYPPQMQWPEVVGWDGDDAAKYIQDILAEVKADQEDFDNVLLEPEVQVVPDDGFYTTDYWSNRVRVFVDPQTNVVTSTPSNG